MIGALHKYGQLSLMAAAVGGLFAMPASAQIVMDGRLGPAGPLAGPNFLVTASLGQQLGGNLFHSFSQFSINTGQSATFSGPGSIANIIGRVTGGSGSTINGLLQSTIAGANLWFINPAGIVFGPNAQLSVTGSFHASTASYLTLGSSGRFDAVNPGASVLTSAAPSAFGFLGPTPAPIAVNGATLQAPDGKTLSLVGGDVSINGATLAAPAGRINLASAAAAGEIVPGATGIAATAQLGSIAVSDSTLHTNGVPGLPSGTIHIRGGSLMMSRSSLFSDNSEAGPGGGIRVEVSGDTLLDDAFLGTWALGAGAGGDVTLDTGRLTMVNGGQLVTDTFSSGRGGNLGVTAAESISISGRNAGGFSSGLLALSENTGNSGSISLSTPRLAMGTGGILTSEAHSAGAAGNINVTARRVALDNAHVVAHAFSSGNAGNINIQAEQLELTSGGSVSSNAFGAGRGGDISVRASESVSMGGSNSNGGVSGLYSVAELGSSGDAGSISVTTPLLVLDDGRINTTSRGAGNAGDILLQGGRMVLVNGGQVNSSTFGSGNGGNLTAIASESITAAGHSPVFLSGFISSTTRDGAGGSILLTAPLLVLDGGVIATGTVGIGDAGNATIRVDRARLVNGGRVDASTFVLGRGGNIDLTVDGDLVISGSRDAAVTEALLRQYVKAAVGNSIFFTDANYAAVRPLFGDFASSGLFSRSVLSGPGGAINVSAANITIGNGGRISAESVSVDNAGSITINAGSTLKLLDGGAITTQAGLADGGNIRITARDLIYLRDSQITTAVGQGQGNGGNIFIDPIFVVLDNSQIIANAFGGNGGNINIISDYLIVSGDSLIQASSRFGASGTITTAPPNADVNAALATLPSGFFDASLLLRESCAARAGRASNSFAGVGRGGLPASPAQLEFGSYAEASVDSGQLAAGSADRSLLRVASIPAMGCLR